MHESTNFIIYRLVAHQNATSISAGMRRACRETIILNKPCSDMVENVQRQFQNLQDTQYSDVADLCYRMGHCSRRLKTEMHAVHSHPIISTEDKVKTQLDCSICLGLAHALAVNPTVGEDDDVIIEIFCNTTGFFIDLCKQMAQQHRAEFTNVANVISRVHEVGGLNSTWPTCVQIGLCLTDHYARYREAEKLANDTFFHFARGKCVIAKCPMGVIDGTTKPFSAIVWFLAPRV